MNEELQKQLVRQLKILNFWITLFGTAVIICAGIIGVLLFKTFTFVERTSNKLNDIEQKTVQALNVKDKLCASSSLLENRDFCSND